MKKNTQTSQKKAAKAPRRARKSARSVKVDPRWSFELGATEWGPFKTKGAKINSARNMVGLGERAVDIQRKMPRLRTTINENGNTVDILTGTDFIKAVTLAENATVGDVLYKQEITPSGFAGTRLQQFSQLYQRYRFRHISFVYEPIANATQSGQLLGFADFDVDNQINTNSSENLATGAAHQGQAITQIWQSIEFDMAQVFTFTDLFTEVGASETDDARMSIQGVFYLLAASQLPLDVPLGNIYVDYEIEFSIPFLSFKSSNIEHRSAGYLSYNLTLPSSGNTMTVAGSATTVYGPSVVTTSGIGSRTMQFTGLSIGDVVRVVGFLNPPSATTYTGNSSPGLPLDGFNVAIEGGSITGTVDQTWRNLTVTGAPAIFGAVGNFGFNFTSDNTTTSYVSLEAPVWADGQPANVHYGFLMWVVVPAAVVESARRAAERAAIKDAPRALEAMKQQMSLLTQQLETFMSSSPSLESVKGKEKLAPRPRGFEQSSSTSGEGGPAPSPRVSFSPDLSQGTRPRSSSLRQTLSPRVSDDIINYKEESDY